MHLTVRARAEREGPCLSRPSSLSLSLSLPSTRLGSCDRKHTLDGIEIPREEEEVMVVASADEVRKPRGTYYPR